MKIQMQLAKSKGFCTFVIYQMTRRKVQWNRLLAVSSFREILAVTVKMLDIAAAFLKDRQNALDIVHCHVLTNIRLTNCMYVPQ